MIIIMYIQQFQCCVDMRCDVGTMHVGTYYRDYQTISYNQTMDVCTENTCKGTSYNVMLGYVP